MVGIRMPDPATSPVVGLLRRLVIAMGALTITALIVYFGRDGYTDHNSTTPISLGDAFYYATVAVTTTGYGDIVPVSPTARWVTTIFVTPLRLIFLIVFVGTTVELLTESSTVVPDRSLEEARAQPRRRRRLRHQGAGRGGDAAGRRHPRRGHRGGRHRPHPVGRGVGAGAGHRHRER